MPLHLLGKKSWNVYNKDNIERVRRDEAKAKAAEEAEEQRMQEVDAARRLAILRGQAPPPIEQDEEAAAPDAEAASGSRPSHSLGTGRRPRKRHGEDDTDFELRIAKECELTVNRTAAEAKRTTSSAPIVDRRGHIDLFGRDNKSHAHTEKNEEAEREANRKRREYEDQYTMRFVNAGGQPGLDAPWYSADGHKEQTTGVMKNVWGRDDPQRKERDEKRIVASDPLAMMKQGAAKVRELKQERQKFQDERERELRQLKREDERRERHGGREHRSRRGRSRSPTSDERRGSGYGGVSRRRREDERSRHGRRDRDRSREWSRDERRRRHRSHSRERDGHGRQDDEKGRK